jgi:hypothetical protein
VGEDILKLTFDVGGGRSQVLFVTWSGPSAEEARFLDLHSPIGRVEQLDLHAAVRRTSQFVIGGLSMLGEVVTLRHCAPLENLDRNEIDEPMHRLLGIADELEAELTGRDDF